MPGSPAIVAQSFQRIDLRSPALSLLRLRVSCTARSRELCWDRCQPPPHLSDRLRLKGYPVDIGTGLSILGSAKLLEQVLGPTASYVGEGIRDWTEHRVANVKRIFEIAHERLGSRVHEPGGVPPRVLKEILGEGSFSDDPLMSEYFGGVLASSRSTISRNDVGATYLSWLGRLSAYQIRAHYVIYRALALLFKGCEFGGDENALARIFISHEGFNAAMDFCGEEDSEKITTRALLGLVNEYLLCPEFTSGSPEVLRDRCASATEPGLVVQPSLLGLDLFLWAHGQSSVKVNDFFKAAFDFPSLTEMRLDMSQFRISA